MKSNLPDFEDQWARVELFRWQYGHLPGEEVEDSQRRVEISEALKKIAEGIEKGCREKNSKLIISPFNLVQVLNYVAKILKKEGK